MRQWSRDSIQTGCLAAIVSAIIPCFAAAEGVQSADPSSDIGSPVDRGEAVYVEDAGGDEIELFRLREGPYHCDIPDTAVPIAIPCGPNPYSRSSALFEALADVDISVEVQTRDSIRIAILDFKGVVAGAYSVRFEGPSIEPGLYWIVVSCNGRVAGKAPYAFVGTSLHQEKRRRITTASSRRPLSSRPVRGTGRANRVRG